MKKYLKAKCFDDVEVVKTTPQRELNDMKVEEFQGCFKQLEKKLNKCIASTEDCFESDK